MIAQTAKYEPNMMSLQSCSISYLFKFCTGNAYWIFVLTRDNPLWPEVNFKFISSWYTHWVGGWVGPSASLDLVEKRNIFCPCRESKPGCQPITSHYTDWAILTHIINFRKSINLCRYYRIYRISEYNSVVRFCVDSDEPWGYISENFGAV
jgi:hypothetical protein